MAFPTPPPQFVWCTWIPGRRTKNDFVMHASLGNAKAAITSGTTIKQVDPYDPAKGYTWIDCAIWRWENGQWFLWWSKSEGEVFSGGTYNSRTSDVPQ